MKHSLPHFVPFTLCVNQKEREESPTKNCAIKKKHKLSFASIHFRFLLFYLTDMNKHQRDADTVVVTEGEQLSLNKKKSFKEKRKHALSIQAPLLS